MKKLPLFLAISAALLISFGWSAHISHAIFQREICDQDSCAPRGDVSGNYSYTPRDSVSVHVECISSKTLGFFGGGQKHCRSASVVRGQAFRFQVISDAVDPSPNQNAWITGCAQSSTVWGDSDGMCWGQRRWDNGGSIPTVNIDANGGAIYRPFHYFLLDILVKATNVDANWQSSTLYGDGRVAQIKDLSVNGNNVTAIVNSVKNAILKINGNVVAGGDFGPPYTLDAGQSLNSNFDTSKPATFVVEASGPNENGVYSTISQTLNWPPPGQKYSCQNNACVIDSNGQYDSLNSCSAAGCGGSGATSPPGGFTLNQPACSGGGNPSVSLSWSQSPSAYTYDIYRCAWSFCAGLTKVGSGLTTTSYRDTDVRGDTDYYYTVTAVNNLGSKDSNQASVSTAAQNCTGGGSGRNKCVNNSCVFDPNDSGPNQCSPVGSTCAGGPGRNKCEGNACVFVPNDSGPDQCSTNSDCTGGNNSHTVCQTGACVSVPGSGSNQCATNADCPQPTPTCDSFSASPEKLVIPPPAKSTLSWSCNNVSSCSIDNGVGSVPTSGSVQVSPSQTTTYTLTCDGIGTQTQVQTSTNITLRVFEFVGGALKEINPQ